MNSSKGNPFSGHELGDVADIWVPQVSLTKDRGRVWFLDGWQDCVASNSVSASYVLVFTYEKNSTFQALMFYEI